MPWRPGLISSQPSVDDIYFISGRDVSVFWFFFFETVFVYAVPGRARLSSSKTHFDSHFWEEKSVMFLKRAVLLLQCKYVFGCAINAFSNGFLSPNTQENRFEVNAIQPC